MADKYVWNFNVNVTQVRGEIIEVNPQIISEILGKISKGELVAKGKMHLKNLISTSTIL